ncbi:pyridoxal-phosphate-dependent aminotransferase family protein [Arcobacter sp.]|uniref:pyridoxal-phosphate-dependent aminotransferase family protein n=1 Tax=unclassified Arcobacter TaxID=2593671 RepID=UPI003B00F54C
MKKQYIFTPGPVPMSKEILKIGKEQVPYFRNDYFSNILLESKRLLLKLANAPENSDVVFITSSGTGAMEATVMNLLNENDEAIIVNGGGFGQRFVDICDVHNIKNLNYIINKNDEIDFENIEVKNKTSFIINAHETTIGRFYNLKKVGKFCKKNNLVNIVDAISSFVCDDIDMQRQNIDALIISSNKGLALPPGLAMIILSPRALSRIQNINNVYFNFKNYLEDIKRGQTPFTPAISIIKQLHFRLKELDNEGIEKVINRTSNLAKYFRKKISKFPFEFYVNEMPNAMTAITPSDGKSAYDIVLFFEKNYNIILTPSGGDLKDKVIRISHMGNMDKKYLDVLFKYLKKYYKKG